jgi:transcription termination factor Rho
MQIEIQQAGVENVQVWTAQEVLANYAAFQKQRSVIERVLASVAADERTVQDDNLEAAQEGYSFVTIPVSDQARLEEIRQILATHPIRRAHYYGRYTMTDLALYAAR